MGHGADKGDRAGKEMDNRNLAAGERTERRKGNRPHAIKQSLSERRVDQGTQDTATGEPTTTCTREWKSGTTTAAPRSKAQREGPTRTAGHNGTAGNDQTRKEQRQGEQDAPGGAPKRRETRGSPSQQDKPNMTAQTHHDSKKKARKEQQIRQQGKGEARSPTKRQTGSSEGRAGKNPNERINEEAERGAQHRESRQDPSEQPRDEPAVDSRKKHTATNRKRPEPQKQARRREVANQKEPATKHTQNTPPQQKRERAKEKEEDGDRAGDTEHLPRTRQRARVRSGGEGGDW